MRNAMESATRNWLGEGAKTAGSTAKIQLVSPRTGRRIVFDATPSFNESQSVNYSPISVVQTPGAFMRFEGSTGRRFDLSEIVLVSRNGVEARQNLVYLHTIRGWCKPYFGDGKQSDRSVIAQWEDSNSRELVDWQGAPPEILRFSAYTNTTKDSIKHRIPVVIENYTFNYPNNTSLIRTAVQDGLADDPFGDTPFPIMMTIGLSLSETHSPDELNAFDLISYRNGILPGY